MSFDLEFLKAYQAKHANSVRIQESMPEIFSELEKPESRASKVRQLATTAIAQGLPQKIQVLEPSSLAESPLKPRTARRVIKTRRERKEPTLEQLRHRFEVGLTKLMRFEATEYDHQKQFITWKRIQVLEHPNDPIMQALRWVYANANGEKRAAKTAKRLRAQGVEPGVPDLGLDKPRGKYHGLRIEVKRPGASEPGKRKRYDTKTSQDQDAWIAELTRDGYFVRVCVGWIEIRDCVLEYLRLGKE
jgi:VRR-NUC domain